MYELIMQEMIDLREAVEKGADWADKKDPYWYQSIDISSLNMNDPYACICGQLFMDTVLEIADSGGERFHNGYYYAEAEFFGGHQDKAAEYGFNLPSYDWQEIGIVDNAEYEQERFMAPRWEFLAECWIVQIEKRLADAGLML